mmetsp:Transcript_90231/g.156225  ORF Transcript_90231/g.156225 Transcript_90231/m.156225 type:complete len:261 (+) Transcript_90231:1400-2182(+)
MVVLIPDDHVPLAHTVKSELHIVPPDVDGWANGYEAVLCADAEIAHDEGDANATLAWHSSAGVPLVEEPLPATGCCNKSAGEEREAIRAVRQVPSAQGRHVRRSGVAASARGMQSGVGGKVQGYIQRPAVGRQDLCGVIRVIRMEGRWAEGRAGPIDLHIAPVGREHGLGDKQRLGDLCQNIETVHAFGQGLAEGVVQAVAAGAGGIGDDHLGGWVFAPGGDLGPAGHRRPEVSRREDPRLVEDLHLLMLVGGQIERHPR